MVWDKFALTVSAAMLSKQEGSGSGPEKYSADGLMQQQRERERKKKREWHFPELIFMFMFILFLFCC